MSEQSKPNVLDPFVGQLYDIDAKTGTMRLNLHEGQQEAWLSRARFIFIIAGTQSGKTSYGGHWLRREIETCGPGDYLAVTSNYDLFKLKMLPEMQMLFCDVLKWGKYSPSDRVIYCHRKTTPPTRIILRSAQSTGGLESSTAKAAWIDECGQDDFTLEAWEAILRRLALNRGRVLGTTTPYNLGWLKVNVFDRWRSGDPNYHVIQFKSTMNPVFPVEEYIRARDTMPFWRWDMFYNGNFTRPAAMIFSEYNDTYKEYGGNLVKPFKVPNDWPRYPGIDFGSVNTALAWPCMHPGTGELFVYRCTLESGTSRDHARSALEYNEPVAMWLGGSKSEDAQRGQWAEAGVPVILPLINDVEAGIDNVQSLFKTKRLFIFDTLTGLRSELGSYSRELDESGEPTEKISHKERYHRIDALRYACSAFNREHEPEIKRKNVYVKRSIESILRDQADEQVPSDEYGVYNGRIQ